MELHELIKQIRQKSIFLRLDSSLVSKLDMLEKLIKKAKKEIKK